MRQPSLLASEEGRERDCCGNVPGPGTAPHLYQGFLSQGRLCTNRACNMESFDWVLWLSLILWCCYAAYKL
jgi:hypothetical protein